MLSATAAHKQRLKFAPGKEQYLQNLQAEWYSVLKACCFFAFGFRFPCVLDTAGVGVGVGGEIGA